MYGQKNQLDEAVQPDSYVCNMLLRERMNLQQFLKHSQVLTLLT